MNLPIKTLEDIRKLEPCYDPGKYAPEDWTGTALDILKAEQVPAEDRLWVAFHEGWIDDKTMRLFAVWCARQALALVDNPDPRSVNAVDVAERYANGNATKKELAAAWAAAWAAALYADWAADWAAALYADWAAARAAAWAAARAAARAADWAADWAAARAAAWAAAWAAQVKQLIKMLEE